MENERKVIGDPANGISISKSGGKPIISFTKVIKHISIENIIDLARCGMSVKNGRTMQIYEFKNGAMAELTFDEKGKFEVFQTTDGVKITSHDGETIILSMVIKP